VVFGKYRGAPHGSVTLSGIGGHAPYTQRFEVARATPAPEHRALAFLWARSRIASLSDYGFGELDPAAKAEVLSLGLRYSLLTQLTSFVAVSRTVRNFSGPATNVNQASPLPAGVSNSAVGEEVQGADEPELLVVGLLAAGVLGLAMAKRRARALEAA
jgi:Ca-activated chloride channel homolog